MLIRRGSHRSSFAEEYFDAWKQVRVLSRVHDLVNYQTAHGCKWAPNQSAVVRPTADSYQAATL